MIDLLHYIEAHPWWTLVYLLALSGMFRITIARGR